MKQYFEQFEEKLQTAEEKLDILSDWHIAKGHKGAAEIAEECRTAITTLWMEFYKLSEAYKEAEADHEEFYQANVNYLLGELFLKDTELLEWILFKILNMPAFDKFIEPEAVAKEIDSYKKENDYLYAFVTDDYTERDLHLIERVPLKWIKEEYRTFLAENDLSAHIPYSFGKDLIRTLRVHTGGKYSLRKGRLKKKEAEVFPYPLTIAEYTEYPLRLVEKDG